MYNVTRLKSTQQQRRLRYIAQKKNPVEQLTDEQFGVEKNGCFPIPRRCLIVQAVNTVQDVFHRCECHRRTQHSILQTRAELARQIIEQKTKSSKRAFIFACVTVPQSQKPTDTMILASLDCCTHMLRRTCPKMTTSSADLH